MSKQISVTRALVELKQLEDRINRAINSGEFVGVTVGRGESSKKIIGENIGIGDKTKKIQGAFDKVEALIQNRSTLKSAIVLSNSKTIVSILGQTVTVAEAIDLKSTVEFRKNYLNELRKQLTKARTSVISANTTLEQAIERQTETLLGSDKSKVDQTALEVIGRSNRDQKEQSLLDPCDIEAKIVKVEDEIGQLTSELDFVLSESNARTIIEVDLLG